MRLLILSILALWAGAAVVGALPGADVVSATSKPAQPSIVKAVG
jgi:hypothetical protein